MTDQEKSVVEYMDMRKEVNERLDILRESIRSNSELLKLQLDQIEWALDGLSYAEGYYQELKLKKESERIEKLKKA